MSIYRILYGGAWRPVTHMFRGDVRVLHPEQATAAVVEVDGGYLPILVSPGDIFSDWAPELPPESAWERVPE